MGKWTDYAGCLHTVFTGLRVTGAGVVEIEPDEAFRNWRDSTISLTRRRGTVYLIGNGASASMASHFAADLSKNAGVHAQVFSDLSLITAISNDMGYQHVFAEPLRRRGRQGDMLVAISSSGRSPNILSAAEVAKELGMTVVTLTAHHPANPLRAAGSLNFYLAAQTYGLAETSHAAVLHYWMDLVQAAAA